MKIDLDHATGETHFSADVCIAGAGVAGLTLAHALLHSGLQVALLEGGGVTPEERSQELYNVESVGHRHTGATLGRFRTFGGSSTQWGGQVLPYPRDVFDPPSTAGMQCWPIESSELEPFYPAVLRNLGLPEEPFQVGNVASGGTEPAGNNADVAVRFSRWAPFAQRNLSTTLGTQVMESSNTTIYFHANVMRLELGGPANDTITRVHAVNFKGQAFTFSASHVVVCMGVIETSRLLLVSRVGAGDDQVGRYFHDHIGVHAATLESTARQRAIRLFAPRVRGNALFTPKLEATTKWRTQNGTPSVMAHFPIIEPDDSATATIRMILQALQQKRLPNGFLGRLAVLPLGSIEILRLAYSTKVLNRRSLSKRAQYRVNIEVEQNPLPESRITLSKTKDGLGMPRVRLDWRISCHEGRAVRLFARTIQTELTAVRVAPVKLHQPLLSEDGDWLSIAADTYHMMGGARMGLSSTDSVVDSNLKVHGVQNLYVASCAVFPSGGSSNPTFTMMALTLRLAARLRG